MPNRIRRRTLVLGGVAGAAALTAWLKPRDTGGKHSAYFAALGEALDRAGVAAPVLVVDRRQLFANVHTLRSHIGDRFQYRVVAKSLPSLPLLDAVMTAADTRRLMLFHQPFLSQVAAARPDSEVLLGKPLPVSAAAAFYAGHRENGFRHQSRLQWLVDTPERLRQYAALAEGRSVTLGINIEIDVGLHRGGVRDDATLRSMLEIIDRNPRLRFSGLMGYEPHVVKVPGDARQHHARAMAVYRDRLAAARSFLGERWPAEVTLNAGGSPTYQMYDRGEFPCNELSTGSCLVKPTDFDLPTLADHSPACYIATPVLKALDTLQLPVDHAGPLMAAWNPNRARTFFTYGGYWKARPESPPGLSTNPLFGRSTNQEMLNGSRSIDLQPDDWVFLRPTQSEFVFLQFGDMAVFDGGEITDRWPVLSNAG